MSERTECVWCGQNLISGEEDFCGSYCASEYDNQVDDNNECD